ncbi:AAA family ATPase [Pseudomonas putida]|uniref:AAA family ATPase n=1 Tax=Pseudomonas putida TaxID=303 RepID=UPI0037C6AC58
MAALNNQFWKFKRVALMSIKGGVGKTTDSLHICYQLKKKHGLTFQYVDADAQESGTNHCKGRANLVADCKGETESDRERPIPVEVKKLVNRLFKEQGPYVIPNVIKKSGFKAYFAEARNFYDGFVTDTQGADSKIGREVMISSDILIIPVNPSGMVVTELKKLIAVIMDARGLNPDLRVFVVFNRVVSSAKKIAREHIEFVNEMIDNYLQAEHNTNKEMENIHVCETVITERQEIYNNVDVGLNAFELSKGKSLDAEMQFDTLLDEIEYLYEMNSVSREVA